LTFAGNQNLSAAEEQWRRKAICSGCGDARCKALISSSGYIITICAPYCAPLLKTQVFNDVYAGDETGMILRLAKIFVELREKPRRGLTIDP